MGIYYAGYLPPEYREKTVSEELGICLDDLSDPDVICLLHEIANQVELRMMQQAGEEMSCSENPNS